MVGSMGVGKGHLRRYKPGVLLGLHKGFNWNNLPLPELSFCGTLGVLWLSQEVAQYLVDDGVGGHSADLSVLHSPCLWRKWLSQHSSPTWVGAALLGGQCSWQANSQSQPHQAEGHHMWSITSQSHLYAKWDGCLCAVFSNNTHTVLWHDDLSRCESGFLSRLCFLFCYLLVCSAGRVKEDSIFLW